MENQEGASTPQSNNLQCPGFVRYVTCFQRDFSYKLCVQIKYMLEISILNQNIREVQLFYPRLWLEKFILIVDVVWPESKQIMIIDSIFRNFYIPPVIFSVKNHDDGSESKTCIDGKQRLTSVHRFVLFIYLHLKLTSKRKQVYGWTCTCISSHLYLALDCLYLQIPRTFFNSPKDNFHMTHRLV